jgi:hypothetical protein
MKKTPLKRPYLKEGSVIEWEFEEFFVLNDDQRLNGSGNSRVIRERLRLL